MPYMAAPMQATAGSAQGYGGVPTVTAAQHMMPAAQWMPYMQQQMQQWAGAAPGYMRYQHPQHSVAAPMPYMQQTIQVASHPAPLTGTGGSASGVRKSGGRATSSERDTAENNDSGAAGSGGDTDGSESPRSPAGADAQRSGSSVEEGTPVVKSPARGRTSSTHTPTAILDAARSSGPASGATVSTRGSERASIDPLPASGGEYHSTYSLRGAPPGVPGSAGRPASGPRQQPGAVSSADVSAALEAAASADINNKPPSISDTSSTPDVSAGARPWRCT